MDEEVPDELARIAVWRIQQLTEHGFDSSWAGVLAAVPDLQWREAVDLLEHGCPQRLIHQLLR
jgi:hypothetical protein